MLRCESLQRHYLSVPLDHNGYYDVAIWLRRACLAPDLVGRVPLHIPHDVAPYQGLTRICALHA